MHLLPSTSADSLLGPDVVSAEQSAGSEQRAAQEEAMVAHAGLVRDAITPQLLHGADEMSLHIPQ